MNGSSTSSPSGNRPRSAAAGGISAVQQVLELLRRPAGQPDAVQPDRSDVRAAVLSVLAEHPMNGYEIVRTIEERSGGRRTPGAGAVYPMLQLLADEGLATGADEDGRKTWSLTAAGDVAARAAASRSDEWETPGTRSPERRGALAKAGAQLAQTVALVALPGTPEQVTEAVAVLEDARRRIFAILARS